MSDDKKKSQRFIVTLPNDLHEQLAELAEKNRRSMAEEVRIAIEERLKQVAARKGEDRPLGVGMLAPTG